MKTVADFFAGIGLVEMGLDRAGWSTVYALDYSDEKRQMYEGHFGSGRYDVRDIRMIEGHALPHVTLAHASFPCTDVSLAGSRKGLAGKETSAFWGFVNVLAEMEEHRPPFVLLENVEGFISSHKGRDLNVALNALGALGYSLDLMLIDASHFVPQSRSRLFIFGNRVVTQQDSLAQELVLHQPTDARPSKITQFIRSHSSLPWHLNSLPQLPKRSSTLADIVDTYEPWWSEERSAYLFSQMFERHQAILRACMNQPAWSYGTVFRRTRWRDGAKRSTAELRTDGIAGCLRTPKGGSARQIIVRAGFGQFDARLLNGRENARLMGADDYILSDNLSLNQILFGFGDAVCVPVIEWIGHHVLNPAFAMAFGTSEQVSAA